MSDAPKNEFEVTAREHVDLARRLIDERAEQLGRALKQPEREWLVKGAFRHQYGDVLGNELAAVALDGLKAVDGTGGKG